MASEAPKSDKMRQLIRLLDGSIDDARRRRLNNGSAAPAPASPSGPSGSPMASIPQAMPLRATPKR